MIGRRIRRSYREKISGDKMDMKAMEREKSRKIHKDCLLIRTYLALCSIRRHTVTYLVFKARYAFAKLYNIYVKRVQDTFLHTHTHKTCVHPSV